VSSIFKILLSLHITGGVVGLLLGTYVMLVKKGDKRHRLLGKIFAIAMLTVGFSSFGLAIIHPNTFLFAVGIFTIYMTATSWRYLYLKKITEGQKPKLIDWSLQIFMTIGSLWFLKLGTQLLFHKQYFGIVLLLFAWRGFAFVYQDYKTYKGVIKAKNYWLLFHLQRMVGAYIAAFTAFLVVNTADRLSFFPWLLPSAIFVPLIIKWSRKYLVAIKNKSL
jgi:uncharacterized membrane protein